MNLLLTISVSGHYITLETTIHAIPSQCMNAFHVVEKTRICQRKDAERNTHDEVTNQKFAYTCCCCC